MGGPGKRAGLASTRLRVVQSSDGALRARMERVPAVIDLEWYGETLKIISSDRSSILLELESLIGPLYRFKCVLSPDGNSEQHQGKLDWSERPQPLSSRSLSSSDFRCYLFSTSAYPFG